MWKELALASTECSQTKESVYVQERKRERGQGQGHGDGEERVNVKKCFRHNKQDLTIYRKFKEKKESKIVVVFLIEPGCLANGVPSGEGRNGEAGV